MRRTGRARAPGAPAWTGWAMLSPVLVVFGVFIAYPLVGAVATSLTEDPGVGRARPVGLANYAALADDPVFWRAAGNTAALAALSVPLVLGVGLGVALLLLRAFPGRAGLRALFLAPYVVSGVVVAMLGRTIFDENVGVVNRALRALGASGIPWQSSSVAASLSVLLVLVWARSGLAVIVYLAALQDAPRDLVEAAELEGAGPWARLRHVVLPHLRPTTFFLAVVVTVETFRTFDVVYVLTGGGPRHATELLVTYSWTQAFDARAQGYGAAIGIVVLVVVLTATALWWRVQRRTEADA